MIILKIVIIVIASKTHEKEINSKENETFAITNIIHPINNEMSTKSNEISAIKNKPDLHNLNFSLLNTRISLLNTTISSFNEILTSSYTEPTTLDYDKLLNNGTFDRILLVNEPKIQRYKHIYILCETKFDEFSKEIKISFKIHFLNLKLILLKNISTYNTIEIEYFNDTIDKIMKSIDDLCKLSLFNYKIKDSIISVFKKFDRKKNFLKKKYVKDLKKEDLNINNIKTTKINNLLHNKNNISQPNENINLNVGLCSNLADNKSNSITNNKNKNINYTSTFDENINLKCNDNMNSIDNENSNYNITIKKNSNILYDDCLIQDLNSYTKSKAHSYFNHDMDCFSNYKELYKEIIKTQTKINYVLQKYKNYFFNHIEKTYKNELYKLKKNIIKKNMKDIKKSEEFFFKSKNKVKNKTHKIIDSLEKDLVNYLLF